MAVNKPVKKGTNQRFSQTKNITVGTGDYGNKKSFNLTKKQLGARGSKAASTRKIAISRTQYDPSRKQVLGPMGKPITGRVDMGGGNIAVYKNGVRVTAKKAAPSKPSGGGGRGGNGGGGGGNKGGDTSTKRSGISRGPLMQADRNPRPKPAGDKGTNRGPIAQGDRKPRPNPQQKISISNSGFVRGNKGSSSVANYMAKGMTRSEALRAKRVEDTKNQNRNAAGIAALTLGPALAPLLGTPAAASVVGAVGRTVVGRGVTAAGRKIAGGTVSKSGKSTSNKVSVAAFKAGRAIKPKVDKALGINFKGSNVKIKPKPTPKKKP